MALVTLTNLYCDASDIADYLSGEGLQLRLDDRNQARGQTIQVTTDAALGATALSVAAIDAPLPKGTVLLFDGGGMDSVLEVTLSATAQVGDLSLSVSALTAAVTALAVAFDNGVNTALNARVLKSIQWATAQVKMYCCGRYNDSDLATSHSVNRWTTVIAAARLCRRRGQGVPQSLAEDLEEAMGEMKLVRIGSMSIEDIGTRTSGWPFVTNVTVDQSYYVAKVRVEPQISEATPTQYGQFVDWGSLLFFDI